MNYHPSLTSEPNSQSFTHSFDALYIDGEALFGGSVCVIS